MTIEQLIYFLGVVKNNSITKTSKDLYVSQPAISLAIKCLEEELHCELFIRNNNKLTITEAGKYLVSLATPIVGLFNNVPKQMQDFVGHNMNLSIGIPPMLGVFIFPSIFDQFGELYPNINIKMSELASEANQKAVLNNDLDVCLTVIYNKNIDEQLDYVKIGETQLIFCTKKGTPLSGKKSVSLEDIKDVPLLLLKEGSLQYKIVNELFKEKNLVPNIRLTSNQLYTIKELLNYGNVGAFLFNQVVKKNEEIVGIPLNPDIKFDIVMAWKKHATIPEPALKFINFIKQKTF